MRAAFWRNRAAWQQDTSEYVFLANAVLKVGRGLYPEAWSDADPAYTFPQPAAEPIPSPSILSPRWGKKPDTASVPALTPEEDAKARAAAAASLARLHGVMAVITREAERQDGLRTVYRRKVGFGFAPIPREWWQVTNYGQRFDLCQINTSEPASIAAAGQGQNWAYIFVDRGDLDRLVTSLRKSVQVADPYKTGLAGRPGSKQLLLLELERRISSGEVEDKVSAEARYLSSWLNQAHPEAPQVGVPSTENAIRDRHREAKAARPR